MIIQQEAVLTNIDRPIVIVEEGIVVEEECPRVKVIDYAIVVDAGAECFIVDTVTVVKEHVTVIVDGAYSKVYGLSIGLIRNIIVVDKATTLIIVDSPPIIDPTSIIQTATSTTSPANSATTPDVDRTVVADETIIGDDTACNDSAIIVDCAVVVEIR